MGEHILVTGASGFVGQHLVRRLVADGHDVTAVDIRNQPPESFAEYVGDEVDYYHGSVIHEDFVENVLFPTPNTYDRIFHLAAVVGVDNYIETTEPLYPYEVNFNGTKYLLEQIHGSRTRFVYTSTSEVYGKNPEVPWAEDDNQVLGPPTTPRWSYAVSKSLCEHMIHQFSEVDLGASSAVVRPFNLYGPYQRPDFVIPKFIEMVLDGEAPTVYDDGTQSRCFTYIDDFVEGIVRASEAEHDGSAVYNLGGTDEIQIKELANRIIDIADEDVDEPRFVSREQATGRDFDDIETRIPDVSRAKRELDWEATTPLTEGIEETIEWMRETES
ncbi:NAD-dependent epimerase/dehydratase family protein [Haloplanus aerogenes]|uniref:SDR family NAD(P)-dependent oxidoreductase n=1 Tax=Haloplanus aerogenes TaxID=660522 RepID=A0A3M0D9Z3_9EURY|nr:SDR family NAD(P)-dependent oxidoreductase [Haloplanus aerogenes]AZH26324.1 SDR family NAD(P)-dependent oxidoreductase [Haloplanus aerogenes]RMB18217.1 UDP-glucose 4-epimerase [Haloplanus aerogenes]